MNARNRIAAALLHHDWPDEVWTGQSEDYLAYADVMLATLPDLLTDPETVQAAAGELRRWEAEFVTGISADATPTVTHRLLTAAARAITGD